MPLKKIVDNLAIGLWCLMVCKTAALLRCISVKLMAVVIIEMILKINQVMLHFPNIESIELNWTFLLDKIG